MYGKIILLILQELWSKKNKERGLIAMNHEVGGLLNGFKSQGNYLSCS